MCGAEPILVDVDPTCGLLTPKSIAEAIANYDGAVPPTVLVAVDIHSQIIPTALLRRDFPNLRIVTDAAQSFDCLDPLSGCPSGAFSDFAVLSFKEGKLLSCGEGGCVLTNDPALYQRVLLARNHGDCKSAEVFGGNFHLTELEAAVLKARLRVLPDTWLKRHNLSASLSNRLETLSEDFVPMTVTGPPFIFWGLLDPKYPLPDGFTRGYHTPICCVPYYKRELKLTCCLCAHIFNTNMIWCKPPDTPEQADRIYNALVESLGGTE